MVAGKYTPIDLFAVVVRMIVAVPRGSDISRRPVCKQAWRYFIRPQAASQEILILVPNALKFAVGELNSRMRPEFLPLRFRVVAEISQFRFGEFRDAAACDGFCIEVFRGINMVLRNRDQVWAAANCRLLLEQPFEERIARRGHNSVNA